MKKMIVIVLSVAVLMCGTSMSFADETSVGNNINPTAKIIDQEGNGSVEPLSNKHRTVKVYQSTDSGTEYNSAKTRKCVWTEKHYKVYQENIGTGARQFKYNEYHWTWKGYKKVDGSWTYVKTKTGITRDHTNASNIYSFLTSF